MPNADPECNSPNGPYEQGIGPKIDRIGLQIGLYLTLGPFRHLIRSDPPAAMSCHEPDLRPTSSCDFCSPSGPGEMGTD
jgi:hypothetical protein